MNINRFKSIFASAALCAFLGACASPAPKGSPSFILVSNQKDRIGEFYVSAGDAVKAEDCTTSILFFSFGVQGHSDESLLTKALEKSNADALMDTKFTHTDIIVPILFSNSCTAVTGTPFKLKEQL